MYYWLQLELASETLTYTQESLGLLGIFAEVGGLGWFLMTVLAFFLRPWAEFQFIMAALQKLYVVKSKENPLRRSNHGSSTSPLLE